ncbi:hypothetical protein ACSQ67_003382 [Phaseolus vulgaris]
MGNLVNASPKVKRSSHLRKRKSVSNHVFPSPSSVLFINNLTLTQSLPGHHIGWVGVSSAFFNTFSLFLLLMSGTCFCAKWWSGCRRRIGSRLASTESEAAVKVCVVIRSSHRSPMHRVYVLGKHFFLRLDRITTAVIVTVALPYCHGNAHSFLWL